MNNITSILISGNSKSIQDSFFYEEIDKDIIHLQKMGFVDSIESALMAECILLLTDEYGLYLTINNIGGAEGAEISQIRYSAIATSRLCVDTTKIDLAYNLIVGLALEGQPDMQPNEFGDDDYRGLDDIGDFNVSRETLVLQTRTLGWISGNRYLSESERENNAKIIYSRLKKYGWRTAAIAGILGNIYHESGMNPGIWQNLIPGAGGGGGWGLVQWTPWTKYYNWCDERGYSYDDGNRQLECIDGFTVSMGQWGAGSGGNGGYTQSFEEFKKTGKLSVEDSASCFLYLYEKPSNIPGKDPDRRAEARKWYNFITNNNLANSTPSTDTDDSNPVNKPNTGDRTPDNDYTPPNSGTTTDNGNQTTADIKSSISVNKLLKRGNEYHLAGRNAQNTIFTVRFFKAGEYIYIPNKDVIESGNSGGSDGGGGSIPVTPPTPDEPNPPNVPDDGGGGDEYREQFVELALSQIGKLKYPDASAADSDRFSFADGVADCSSFVITLYYMITGKKLKDKNGKICTYTGDLANCNKRVVQTNGNKAGVIGQAKRGDIIVYEAASGSSNAHVVIVVDSSTIVHMSNPRTNVTTGNISQVVSDARQLMTIVDLWWVESPVTNTKLNIVQDYCTNNPCYTSDRRITPVALQAHSIGSPCSDSAVIKNNWNSSSAKACTHYVVDCEKEGLARQLLPENRRSWADTNFGNNNCITVEMCESQYIKYQPNSAVYSVQNSAKLKRNLNIGYKGMVLLFAYLCKKYNFNPKEKMSNGLYRVFSHREGALLGLSSNHGDPDHIFPEIGKTMDKFRDDIAKQM